MFLFRGLRDGEWLKRSCSKTFGKVFGSFPWHETLLEIRATDFSFLTSASSGSKSGGGFEFSIVTLFSHRKLGPLNHDSCSESCFGVVPREATSAGLIILAM